MKAIILAAGRGSRLKHHTESCPKGLVPLCGVPLVERMVSSLRKAGIHDIAVITGYRRDDFHYLGLPTFYNPEWDSTNMVMSLACAKSWLDSEPVMICYSDIFISPQDIQNLRDESGNLVLSYDKNWQTLWEARNEDPLDDAETFRIDNHIITEIGQKPSSVEDIQGQYTGLFKLTPNSWSAIENALSSRTTEERNKLSMTEILQFLIKNGYQITGIPLQDRWGEIDTEDDLALYEQFAKDGLYGSWFDIHQRNAA